MPASSDDATGATSACSGGQRGDACPCLRWGSTAPARDGRRRGGGGHAAEVLVRAGDDAGGLRAARGRSERKDADPRGRGAAAGDGRSPIPSGRPTTRRCPRTSRRSATSRRSTSSAARRTSTTGPRPVPADVRTADAPYTTRVLVRRPAKRTKLSGNVVVEMLNPSNLFDLNIGWALSHDEYTRNGDVWVGITAKPVTIAALKAFDPERYASLSMANPLPLDDPRNCADIQTTIAGDSSRTDRERPDLGHLQPGRDLAEERGPTPTRSPTAGAARHGSSTPTASATRRRAATSSTTSTRSTRSSSPTRARASTTATSWAWPAAPSSGPCRSTSARTAPPDDARGGRSATPACR